MSRRKRIEEPVPQRSTEKSVQIQMYQKLQNISEGSHFVLVRDLEHIPGCAKGSSVPLSQIHLYQKFRPRTGTKYAFVKNTKLLQGPNTSFQHVGYVHPEEMVAIVSII